jgi:hypothetical protein
LEHRKKSKESCQQPDDIFPKQKVHEEPGASHKLPWPHPLNIGCWIFNTPGEASACQGNHHVERRSKPRGEILKVISTLDREEGARENFESAGIPFESIFTKTDLGIGG